MTSPFIQFEFILRPLGNSGSGRMADDGMNWWNDIFCCNTYDFQMLQVHISFIVL